MFFQLVLAFLFFSFSALAQEEAPAIVSARPASDLRANFRRVALDLSSTEVRHADEYQESSISPLNAKSETIVNGIFDFVLEYERFDFQWNNAVFMTYGQKKTTDYNGVKDTDKNSDEILFSTEYSHKTWKFEDANVGPFANLSYQTQFSETDGNPRYRVGRGKVGMKLFNGKHFADLYSALVGEVDLTYARATEKFAWEAGFTADYTTREGVKFHADGYYRDYVSYSHYNPEDLRYDLSLAGRMDVQLNSILNLGPFISYRRARSRQAADAGSNFKIGISISFSELFKL